jgi:1-acyl-sn-glycerol-3-phosphate acyltransferase
MKNKRRRREIGASRVFNWILRRTLVPWMNYKFRHSAENSEIFKTLRPPFLLLPNHSCVWDPFLVNSLVPYPIHYVMTDASFRSTLVGLALGLVGSIPKTKGMSDMDSIKSIVRVKDRGGAIGVFPEGQNTWDGHSLPPIPSTAKLAKLLRVPVVTARVAGAYLSRPRWARGPRRGRIVVRFDVAFMPAELKRAKPAEIDSRVSELLNHDEIEFNRSAGVKFVGRRRAEYLERALFICPECRSIATLRSNNQEYGCQACNYRVAFGLTGLFRPVNGSMRFESIRDWNLWQIEEFYRQFDAYRENRGSKAFMADDRVKFQIGYRSRPLAPFHVGRLEMHTENMVLKPDTGGLVHFPINEIRGANVQNNEHWEFYQGPNLYKVTILDPRGCTYKWDLAVKRAAALDKNRSAQ